MAIEYYAGIQGPSIENVKNLNDLYQVADLVHSLAIELEEDHGYDYEKIKPIFQKLVELITTIESTAEQLNETILY